MRMPSLVPVFTGICAADWRDHFAGGTFTCLTCGAALILPGANNGPVHRETCPVCACEYRIPLRGSGAVDESITYSMYLTYGTLTRDDFLAALTHYRPSTESGGEHTWTVDGLTVAF